MVVVRVWQKKVELKSEVLEQYTVSGIKLRVGIIRDMVGMSGTFYSCRILHDDDDKLLSLVSVYSENTKETEFELVI